MLMMFIGACLAGCSDEGNPALPEKDTLFEVAPVDTVETWSTLTVELDTTSFEPFPTFPVLESPGTASVKLPDTGTGEEAETVEAETESLEEETIEETVDTEATEDTEEETVEDTTADTESVEEDTEDDTDNVCNKFCSCFCKHKCGYYKCHNNCYEECHSECYEKCNSL